jgi:single-strand DNA-binding protein
MGGLEMNDVTITVTGFLAAEPQYIVTDSGTALTSLRIGSTPRRFDRESGQWKDDDTTYFTVNCWRRLADNLQGSDLKRGDPIIVTGRLRIRDYEKDGQRRYSAVIEANTVGHDLSRGTARFQRTQRGAAALDSDRQQADDVVDAFLTAPDAGELPDSTGEQQADTEPPRIHAVA